MRTELARVQTDAQKKAFEENGFEEYTFIVNGGCCEICEGIKDKHFKVKDMQPGLNAPPMHPHCRCSTAAYEDSDDYEAWLDFLANGGTSVQWEELKKNPTKQELEKVSEVKTTNSSTHVNGSTVTITRDEAIKRVNAYEGSYKPYEYGQISKIDAGQLYKAVKNGNVKCLPETTKLLYNHVEDPIRLASQRYSQDSAFYDNVANLTRCLLNGDFITAQFFINEIETTNIRLAGKKSSYYKYQKQLKELENTAQTLNNEKTSIKTLDNGRNGLIIKSQEPDIHIGKSVGAKASNYDIELPNKEIVHLTEGTKVSNIETIAGKGRKREIDEIDFLLDKWGGKAEEWQKKKGFGYVDYEGESYKAELHWYEEPTAGKHKWKVKPDVDGNWFIDED